MRELIRSETRFPTRVVTTVTIPKKRRAEPLLIH